MNYISYDQDSFRYLSHYGIKGQKWGIRRYQNEDGSLTSAGVKRYAKKGFTEDSRSKSALGKVWDAYTGAHKYGGEALYNLSSDKERIDRAKKYIKDHGINPADSKKTAKLRKELRRADEDLAWLDAHKNGRYNKKGKMIVDPEDIAEDRYWVQKGRDETAAKLRESELIDKRRRSKN